MQCAAIITNGERCPNKVIPGSKFCYIHQYPTSPTHYGLISPSRQSPKTPSRRRSPVYKKPSFNETEQKILIKTYDYYMNKISNKPPNKFKLVARDLNNAARAIAQGNTATAVQMLTNVYEIGHTNKLIDHRITYPGPHDFKKLVYYLNKTPTF